MGETMARRWRDALVLVDAHNVLFRARASRKAAAWDLLALAHALRDRRLFRREVLLVCDGDPPRGLLASWTRGDAHPVVHALDGSPRAGDDVSFHFSGAGVEADDVIEGLLGSALRPRGMMVVSSDRRLREAAKLHKAQHMPSATLVSWLTRPGHVNERPAFAEAVPLTRLEVESWLRHLGVDAEGKVVEPSAAPGTSERRRASVPASKAMPRTPQRVEVRPEEIPHVDMEYWLRLFPPLGTDPKRRP